MQQQQDLLSSLLGSEVDSILQTLQDQQSLLTGMFKDFVREQQTCAAAVAAQCPAQHTQPPSQKQRQQEQHGTKRSRATELPLNVTLEELYCGAIKRVPVQLRRQDAATGAPVTVLQQLQVCVQPGLHAGTRITLPGLGNLDLQGQQSDLTFVVQQQQHSDFRRLADDLYAIVRVPLVTALTGGPVQLKTLSGQLLQLPVADNTIITPNSELVLRNQGMPVFGDSSGRRGALHVRFRVCFPSHLSSQQQQLLRQALAGADEQQQLSQRAPAGALAAAVVTAAGLLPRPTTGIPLLPPSPTTAKQQQQQQQQEQEQDCDGQRRQRQVPEEKQQPAFAWAVGGSRRTHAAVGVSGSPRSSGSTWTAAAVAAERGAGRTAFAGAAACSMASSSSAAGFAACSMQSTGSSREALGRDGRAQKP